MEKTETISSKIRNNTKVSIHFTLIQNKSEFLARAIRQEKETKEIQTGKELKLSLFVDDMMLSLKDPKKLLDHINIFSKGAEYEINTKNQ
jgi:hypothetical protein